MRKPVGTTRLLDDERALVHVQIFDLIAGPKLGKLDLNLTVNNVLNANWREAQFADESRVTPTAEVVEQMHFTPGIPLTATATAAYTF